MARPDTQLRYARYQCRKAELALRAEPIVTAACYCTSCRTAAELFNQLGSSSIQAEDGSTEYLLYRKDRVACTRGAERLREFHLPPQSTTRRVIATCCNTPLFLEFKSGHWLSVYRERFAPSERTPIDLRTMTADREDAQSFDDTIPTYRKHSMKFMWQLLSAWAQMGFRAPKIDFVSGAFDAFEDRNRHHPQDGT